MVNFLRMVEIQAVLFIYLSVGAIAYRSRIIKKEMIPGFVDFIINIIMPCMVFNSFNQQLTADKLLSAASCLLLSFGISILSFLLGKVLYLRYSFEERCIMQYGTVVSNSGFAGLPLVSTAFGDEALFYASIFMIPTRIFMWSAGLSLFTNTNAKDTCRKVLLNPCVIACEVGLLRMALNLELPVILDTALKNIGGCSSAMSMIIIGAILAEVDIRKVIQVKVLYLSFVRLILLPLITLGIFKLLGIGGLEMASSVLLVGMPAGSTTAILAQKYGADAEFASKCVFVSTVLSLITAPLLTLLF